MPNTFDGPRSIRFLGGHVDAPEAPTGSDSDAESKERFAYDDRPVHRPPAEGHPLEQLSGRGQTEGTPMGLGPLAWVVLGAFVLVLLLIAGSYIVSLFD